MKNLTASNVYSQLQSSKFGVTQLTARQLEVLALLCEGLQNKQIARRLNIAGATVKIHVANILRTLNVTSRLQAAVVAMSVGFRQGEGARQIRGEIAPAACQPAVLRLVPAHDHEIDMPTMLSDWSLEAAAG
jgi:DNA-binding CsgD family transcriptional regulator